MGSKLIYRLQARFIFLSVLFSACLWVSHSCTLEMLSFFFTFLWSTNPVGSISATLLCLVRVLPPGRIAGSFPEQRLVIEPTNPETYKHLKVSLTAKLPCF